MKQHIFTFLIALFITGGTALIMDSITTPGGLTNEDFLEWKREKKQHEKPRFGEPGGAMRWYYEQRAYPDGFIPEDWRREGLAHIREQNQRTGGIENIEALNWTELGPNNIGGRVRAIVVSHNDVNKVWAGGVSGGIWYSPNGGSSWTPQGDDLANLIVCSMVMDPSNANVIYAGTGEGFFNYDAQRGEGIFKTTNGGASWTQLSSTLNENFYFVNKLVFDQSTNTLWAGTRKGIFKSTNGGSSFTAVLTNGSGNDVHCTDIEISPSSPTKLYAAFGLFNQSSIYRSTDAGANWTQVYSQPGYGRIELATSEQNTNDVFASLMDLNTSGTGAMLYSSNSGNSWNNITIPGPNSYGQTTYTGTQGWYNNIMYVKPNNENVVYVAGIDFWVSTNKGTTWTRKTDGGGNPAYDVVHVDQHAITVPASNLNYVFLGTDGGIYKSTDSGESWTAVNNNLNITQFYAGDVNPTGTVYYGGTQDNGTIKSTGGANWNISLGGDGGVTIVDDANSNIVYGEYVNLCFLKSTDAGASWNIMMNGIPKGPEYWDGTTDRVQFIAPFAMDPNNSSTLIAGSYRIYRTTNGAASWTTISGDLTGDGAGSNGATISTVHIAHGNSNVMYAGCSNGRVQVTTDGGANWNLRSGTLPNRYCRRIVSEKNNPGIAYAVYSGYQSGQKIFKTTNYGINWSNISGNLPNIPVNDIVIDPQNSGHYYVATDLGVFSTQNGGTSWVQESSGMPNVVVHDLEYRESDGKLFAFTHGRGLFSAPLTAGGVVSTLQYDDGTPSSGYVWNQSGNGSANRLTPPSGGVQVLNIQIYFTGVNSGTATYKPIILGDNSGSPGSYLATFGFTTASSVPGWDTYDITGSNIYVNGDFYVGLLYDGTNTPSFGYDPANNNRAWDYNGSWSQWNETYFMRAQVMTATGIHTLETTVPENFELLQNYPNPFNPSTTIRYALPEAADVTLIVYDIQGRKIAELVNNRQGAGTYEVTWNGKNDSGIEAASGIYLYTIKAGNIIQSSKMMLLR